MYEDLKKLMKGLSIMFYGTLGIALCLGGGPIGMFIGGCLVWAQLRRLGE